MIDSATDRAIHRMLNADDWFSFSSEIKPIVVIGVVETVDNPRFPSSQSFPPVDDVWRTLGITPVVIPSCDRS
jgi:hypothetical protein